MSKFYDEGSGGGQNRKSLFDLFIKLREDTPTVLQILEPTITKEKNIIWRHYIRAALRKSGQRGMPIVCPGMDICPICAKNKTLPDKSHPDYIAPQKRVVVNVLDLTPVRVCELCQTASEGKECTYCGFNLSDVAPAPLKEIKLLERGTTLFSQLAACEETVTVPYDPDDPRNDPNEYNDAKPGDEVPAGITTFPITIITKRSPKGDVITTPFAGTPNSLDWRDYQDKLLDIKASYIILKNPEIEQLLAGGSLSEILKARNTTQNEEIKEEVSVESQSVV